MNQRPFLVHAMRAVYCVPTCLGLLLAPVGGAAAQEASNGGDEPENEDLPLPVDRTVALDMTEGSWISLDVSPDGRTIVFDYLGDLFTIPIEGGGATQLTSGMAFDAQPRFSPDGTRIVYSSDYDGGQNIWIRSLDGSDTTQISRGSANRAESPEWLPDGTYVVASMGGFRGGGLPKLKMFHVDGGSGIELVSEPDNLKMLGAAVSSDGRYIWYARRTGDWTYNAQFPQYQLEAYDRETGERYTRSSRYGSGIRPTLSPDGRWLVFGTRHEDHTGLVLRDLESGDERWLAYPVQHDDQESRATLDLLPGMSFTPDSRHLVVSYGGKIWKLPIDGGDAEEIPFRVQFDLPLGPRVDFDYPIEDTPTFTVRQIRDAAPSPAGDRLAFTALDRLWVSGADGSNPERLTDADMSEHFATWSPDGEWIAYSTWDGNEGHLYRVRSDGGGDPVRLTRDAATYFAPAWGSGDRIVAVRGLIRAYETQGEGGAPGTEFVWVSADPDGSDGGPATLIAPTDGRADPHFVEGDDRIHLFRFPDALVSIRWDGTDEREHVRVRGPTPQGSTQGLSPSTIQMAPRGDQALAEIQREIYTVTVPRAGVTPTINVSNPDNASFPARRVTDIGGEFPTWSGDGRTVHFSLGNAHFSYDLDAAQAYEDSVEAAEAEEEAEEDADEEAGAEAEEEEEEAEEEEAEEDEGYRAAEHRILIEAPRDIPTGVAVLRGGRAITMDGDEVIENADIVVRNNRIEAVGASGSVTVPDDATVFDISGRTVVPGYVDTHAHLRARDQLHRTDVWPYLANLAYGVTTTRDPQTGNTEVLSYADMVRAGAVLGPRVYSTGPGVFWQDGIDTEEEAMDVLSRYSEYFDTKTIKMYVAAARKGRQHIIMAARELGLMPTTEGSLNLRQNLTETFDGYPGLEHSIPIFPVYDDYVRLFAETGRVYTPTLLVSYGGPWAENYFYSRENPHDDPKLRRFVPHDEVDSRTLRRPQWFREDQHVFWRHGAFVKDLVEAGGKAGVGSHGQLQGLGYHWELWAMVPPDMDEHDALRMATIFGAEAIGLDQDLGSIEAGKLADLVILTANPLDDIRNTNEIEQVMFNGRLYDADTLDEVYPRQRPLAPLWWWDDEPEGVPGVDR
ncbi:amidohydrolase family protein [Candidatus Palauibacter sp.]|uniref:amidohydrolase family protein n=1 Tax=Candidatus Palauibacter sp. TaxID=3101350 RepID=UPI003B0105C1